VEAHVLDTYAPTGATPAKRDYHFPSPVGKMRPRSTVLSRVKGRETRAEEVEAMENQEGEKGKEETATMDHLDDDDDDTTSDRSSLGSSRSSVGSLDSNGTAASVEDIALEVDENEEETAKTTKVSGIPRGGTKRQGARRSLLKTKATRLPRKSIRGANRALKEVKEN
jgi:hypothetical protein